MGVGLAEVHANVIWLYSFFDNAQTKYYNTGRFHKLQGESLYVFGDVRTSTDRTHVNNRVRLKYKVAVAKLEVITIRFVALDNRSIPLIC